MGRRACSGVTPGAVTLFFTNSLKGCRPGSAFADLAAGLTFRACADDHGRLRPARAAGRRRRARGWPGRRTGAPTRHGQRRALRCAPPDLARPAHPIQAATAADEALLAGKLAADRVTPPAGGSGPGPRRPGDAASQRLSHRGDHHGGQVRTDRDRGQPACSGHKDEQRQRRPAHRLSAPGHPPPPHPGQTCRPARTAPSGSTACQLPRTTRARQDPPSLMPHPPRNRCPDLPHDRQVPQAGRSLPPARPRERPACRPDPAATM